MRASIYSIRVLHDDSVLYVGSTNDFKRRNSQHLTALKNGKHENKTLQKAYDSLEGAVYIKVEFEFDDNIIPTRIVEYLYSSMLRGKAHSRGFNMKKGGRGFDMIKHCDSNMANELLDVIKSYTELNS